MEVRASLIPILLGDGACYGTLAAARALGREGIPVTIADRSRVAVAMWSRHVQRRLRCPPAQDVGRFIPWLMQVGRSGPQQVIYSTSDDMSFALALHRDELKERFFFYQPPLDSLITFLDKGRLHEHARLAGLAVPETWMPETANDAGRIAREVGGTLVVKPRTQALLRTHLKGVVTVGDAYSVEETYAQFRRKNLYRAELASRFPEATRPMVQRFYPEAVDGVYSLAGFRDETGQHFAVRAATKVLQQPRRLGIGLCFEQASVDAELAAGVKRLCERIGYFGIFEAEFIRTHGGARLIDLNARLYNQMAFDIARGLPLPQLVYEGALGHADKIAERMAGVSAPRDNGPSAFCNGFGVALLVGAKRLAGASARADAERWQAWIDERRARSLDAVADSEDPRPMAFEALSQVYACLRHPRAFVRSIALDR
jgi:predicted ATP-grasp superfamily ATP-dependent carboligase